MICTFIDKIVCERANFTFNQNQMSYREMNEFFSKFNENEKQRLEKICLDFLTFCKEKEIKEVEMAHFYLDLAHLENQIKSSQERINNRKLNEKHKR